MNKESRIFVAGHQGMVGSAIVREAKARGYSQIICRSRKELDLTDSPAVHEFMNAEKIDIVVLAAARVGGIQANDSYPADFIRDNLWIELSVIDAAFNAGVERLLFLGSSCIYPRMAAQPISESALLTGELEPTNEPYAIAKIAGIKLCESYNRQHGTDYRSIMPTNLYGPGDNYHAENSHVIPALMRRIHDAKINEQPAVTIWGSGKPMREFLFVDDLAKACMHLLEKDQNAIKAVVSARQSHINVGTGKDCTIAELVKTLARVIGYSGELEWDTSKPDGTPRKLLDVSLIELLGWSATTTLEEGLRIAYTDYIDSIDRGTVRRV
ncbi:MAG: GDP-L-fucose synthase [Granulosicoccus sp.]